MNIQTNELPKETGHITLEADQSGAAAKVQVEGKIQADVQDKALATTAYSRQDAEKLLKQAQEYFGTKGINLHFKILQNSGAVQVEMADTKNNKVIREIPQGELAKLSDNLRRMGKGFLDKAV